MSKPLLLIDGNSLAFSAFYAKELGNQQGQGSQVPFTFLNALRSFIASEFIGYLPLVLWDGHSAYRQSIFPEYKANRTLDTPEKVQEREQYKGQVAYLRAALTALGVTQAVAKGFEADDLAYQLLKKSNAPVALVTGDRDWLQMVNRPGVIWFYHRAENRRLVSIADFEKETGVKDRHGFVEVKALCGDASDNIPGVGGIGEKGAKELINTHGSVYQFLDWLRAPGTRNCPSAWRRLGDIQPFEYRKKEYPPAMETFERNLKLVDLAQCPVIPKQDVDMTYGKFDIGALREIAQTLQFKSMLEDLDGWATPFQSKPMEQAA